MIDTTDIEKNVEGAANLLKALSNEKRLMIVCALSHGEKSVSELESIVHLSQSALSQHLAKLRKDKIVRTLRSAQTIYYALSDNAVQKVLGCLHDIFTGTHGMLESSLRFSAAR